MERDSSGRRAKITDEELAWDMAYAEKPFHDNSDKLLKHETEQAAFDLRAYYGCSVEKALSEARQAALYDTDSINPFHRYDRHVAAIASGKKAHENGDLNDEAVARAALYYTGQSENERSGHEAELEQANKIIA